MLNLDELKKDHRTSYWAGVWEQLTNQEKELLEMLAKDPSLREVVQI